MPFNVKNRRHAWDFPSQKDASSDDIGNAPISSSSGFKLTGLLQHMERGGSRSHGGFEQLNQDASDDEHDDFGDQSNSESRQGRISPCSTNSNMMA